MLGNHNPFSLPKEPDFVSDDGSKWWGLGESVKKEYGIYKQCFVEFPDGDQNYVIFDGIGVLYETKNLEALGIQFSLYEMGHLR